MKHTVILPVLVVLLLVGCKYEYPLTRENNLPVDPTVLGLWAEESKSEDQMMILKYSDTEYLVHYPTGKEGLYFRCYPIKVGGIPCIQAQVIGTAGGPPEEDEKHRFHVFSYQLTDGNKLEIKTLNTDLMDDDPKTTEDLMKTFLKHKEDRDLFTDPGKFRKIRE